MKHKKMSWLIATLFSSPLLVQQALAQEAPAGDIQQVNVTGIRASVRNALAAKEASNSMVEVVSAEDIGKLPDTTIAESLGAPAGPVVRPRSRQCQPDRRARHGSALHRRHPERPRAGVVGTQPRGAVRAVSVRVAERRHRLQDAERELVEGGVATTIDLQTVSPLKYNGRQVSLKADALYYAMAKDIGGADKTAPRLGGVYIDQFNNKTLGVALAFSYQDQPSLQKNVRHWGFNEDHSADLNGDGKVDKTPWGFQDEIKRGKDKRTSLLGKVEWKPSNDALWKPSNDALITADTYYAKAAIREPGLQHWTGDLGNWDGYESGNFSKLDIRNGYVAGGTLSNTSMVTNDYLWIQDTSVAASGLNGKFNAGDWKVEADLSSSHAMRSSQCATCASIRTTRPPSPGTSPATEQQSLQLRHGHRQPRQLRRADPCTSTPTAISRT